MNGLNDIQNLLFDLDGTLVDSSETIGTCVDYALEKVGAIPEQPVVVHAFIGRPLLDIFCNEFGLGRDTAEVAIEHYRGHYDRLAQAGSRIYEDVEAVLSDLSRAGYRMFIATVKPAPIAEKVLDDLLLRRYFEGVSGSSMDHRRRDKASIIAHALETFGLAAAHTLMIGDRGQDIAGARDNGLKVVAVAYGYGSREELDAAGPDHIVEHSSGIRSLLTTP